jgi:hypothetical protein
MSATKQRDRVHELAKKDPAKALEQARKIDKPWFKAQALAHVARFTDGDPVKIAKEAESAASQCDDEYKRSAVRAWEIAALAERGHTKEARRALDAALGQSKSVTPNSSRSEALILLMNAAFYIDKQSARRVSDELKSACGHDSFWRCKRAIKDADALLAGDREPRPFHW